MKLYATTDHTGRPTELLLTDEDAKERDLDPSDGRPWPPVAVDDKSLSDVADGEPDDKTLSDGEPPAGKSATSPANKSRGAENK